jgi:hypothetical protein
MLSPSLAALKALETVSLAPGVVENQRASENGFPTTSHVLAWIPASAVLLA